MPGRLYSSLPIEMQSEPSGDCWARMDVRMREIDASLAWLFRVLDDESLDLRNEGAAPVRSMPTLRPERCACR
jgi:NADH:ubiquinone oxidoreductase subunit D